LVLGVLLDIVRCLWGEIDCGHTDIREETSSWDTELEERICDLRFYDSAIVCDKWHVNLTSQAE
jgi:hypothetical protein